jgi:hypothetical protein
MRCLLLIGRSRIFLNWREALEEPSGRHREADRIRRYRDRIDMIEGSSIDHFRENEMSQKSELKNRVEAKKLKLQAKIKELQANASSDSREEVKKLEARLNALGESLRDGWDDLTENVSSKLNQWLKDD